MERLHMSKEQTLMERLAPYFGLRIAKPKQIKFELDRWYGSTIICPKCGAFNTQYKLHAACRNLGKEHVHVKCYKCKYEFGAAPKDN